MRLIDADILFKDIVNRCGCVPYIEGRNREAIYLNNLIDEQPISYDLDKVLEKLQGKIDLNVDMDTGKPCDNWVVNMQNDTIGECIDIVLSGRVGASD